MTHCVTTEDDVQVCGFTGEAPRVGETIMAFGGDNRSFRGNWTVTRVMWVMHPEESRRAVAHVSVAPADDAAASWLESERRARK
jgi:hypothetical protein